MCHKTQTQRPHDKVEEALCVRVNGTELFLLYNIDNSLDFIPLGSERSKSDSKLHLEMFQTRKWQSFCLCTFWKKNVYSDTSCMVLQKKKKYTKLFPKDIPISFSERLCFNQNSQSSPVIQILFGPAVKSNVGSWHQFVAMEIMEMPMFPHYACTIGADGLTRGKTSLQISL